VAAVQAVIEYKTTPFIPESVVIAGLTVSQFDLQADGTYVAVLDDVFGGEIELDQPLTASQVLAFIDAAREDADEHAEPFTLEVVA
jgi:hypothetical protein